ncbi:MAG: hypothetical protein R3360_07655 [Alphaproteobacteria bacterium]|nr:hypothetical protein [Alphaproteobacteria bacterium]
MYRLGQHAFVPKPVLSALYEQSPPLETAHIHYTDPVMRARYLALCREWAIAEVRRHGEETSSDNGWSIGPEIDPVYETFGQTISRHQSMSVEVVSRIELDVLERELRGQCEELIRSGWLILLGMSARTIASSTPVCCPLHAVEEGLLDWQNNSIITHSHKLTELRVATRRRLADEVTRYSAA